MSKRQSEKLINEYSVEELLKLIETSADKEDITVKTEEEQINNEVIRFIIFYDIKPGNYRINSKTLFKLFKAWNKNKNYKHSDFLKNMHHCLERKFGKSNITYLKINKSLTNIVRFIEEAKPKRITFRKTMFFKQFLEEFMEEHKLTAGPIYVEADILYYLFDYYNHKKKRRMISYLNFVSMCHLYLPFRQLGFGSTWFGVNESIKNLITPEWVKTWRQGRIQHGFISKSKKEEYKKKIYVQDVKRDKAHRSKILYYETLPDKESKE